MIRFFLCCLLVVNTVSVQAQNSDSIKDFTALNPNETLVEKVFFERMVLKIPENLKQTGSKEARAIFDIVSFENKEETLWFYIRKKEGDDLNIVKTVHEKMATSFYKGEIHRSEFINVNGMEVYLFEMTGHWNGSDTKESWTKFFTTKGGYFYQCLIKYPEADRLRTEKYRNRIINSFQLKD